MANLLKGYSSLTLFKPVIRPHPWPFSHDTRGVMVMGSGEKSVKHGFHLHLPHLHHHNNHHGSSKKQVRDVPKGCLAIKVGQGEEQQRFVVPVIYFNHPLFMQLLKEAEEEYGFDQKGTITIPCHVEEFMYVQGMIDRENSLHQHHQHHNHIVGCFRV